MKVRYKITAAFVLLTITLLAAMCVLTYYITEKQQENDFNRRIENRISTIASLLNKFPDSSGYTFISKLDTATNNTLSHTTVSVFNKRNEEIYRFARIPSDTFSIDPALVNDARRAGMVHANRDNREIIAVHFPHSRPIVVVISAINELGRQNLNELLKTLMVAFFAGIVLTFLVGWFFSAELVRPIEHIANTVNNISATNIEQRLPEAPVNDEWNKLAVTFNNLLQRLQDSFEIQGRFISNASHELSTPLTALSNQIDVTLQKNRSNEEYLAVLQSIQADVQHMSALTQQLLNIARTARGGTVHTESIRVDEILMDIPSLLKKISPQYNVKLLFDELPENEQLCTINGNYELLLSAFRNLAENGCKYAPDHVVDIALSFSHSRIRIVFSNTYELLQPDELEKMFQPFQRGSNAVQESGYGLGLPLTRRIVLLHKGEIKAEMKDGRLFITVVLPSAFL